MRRNRKATKLKWSLFVGFTAFTLLIILVLWVAQILLLGNFYYWNTKNRMSENAYELAMNCESDSFEKQMENIAEEEGACIAVYRIDGEVITLVLDYEESPACILHHLDSAVLKDIYDYASNEGGVLQFRLSELFERRGEKHDTKPTTDRLLTALTADENGIRYMIFLDAAIFPVESTVSTLRFQLVYISVGLLIISTVLAFIIAGYISRPIEKINEKAKRLPKGQYRTAFWERSYREVEELSETLSQAADEISKVDRLQKELIANISHDLRTPLTMIVGYSEVMRDIEGENTPENVQVIIDEATRLSELVNDLLEISRAQSGNVERKDEIFNLSDVTQQTLDRYRRLKGNSGFRFEGAIDADVIVKADKSKLLQAIYNLINNAINYSTDAKEIKVSLERKEGYMRLSVADRGMGIPKEDLPNVWQRYYRVDKVHRRSIVGSGLGLSIVREILELHGAHYGVMSAEGEGSTFWFELPLYFEEENSLLLD